MLVFDCIYYKIIPQLYSPELMQEYHAAPQPQVRLSHFTGLRAPLPPLRPPFSAPVLVHLFTSHAVISNLLMPRRRPPGAQGSWDT